VSRTLGPRPSAAPGGTAAGWALLAGCWALVALSWLTWAAARLATVAAIQHLLGLAMAVALYLLLLRRGCPAWLAALATAPLLLDAYQVQMEQTIMPDVWFEALAVAGLAILLWRSSPVLPTAIVAGLMFGASATIRQVGEVTLLPALIYVLATAGSWRRGISQAAALCAAFALPVLAYCSASYLRSGHFWLSRAGVTTAYGRMAAAADCASLRVPAAQRPLCPTPRQKALGIDGLEHSPASPLQAYRASRPGTNTTGTVTAFTARVLAQQPLNVLSGIAGDAAKLFALTRNTRTGDTPISRWQFQGSYPTFSGAVELSQENFLVLGPFGLAQSGAMYQPLPVALGRRAAVSRPAAAFLRFYQLNGGYAPGPLLAAAALAGLAGTLSIARRRARASPAERDVALACLLISPWPPPLCWLPTPLSSPGATSCPPWSPCRPQGRSASWPCCGPAGRPACLCGKRRAG